MQVLDRRAANQPHVHLELVLEEPHGSLDTLLTVAAHGIQEGPPDADARRAEAQALDDVARPPHAAVDKHLELVREPVPAKRRHGLSEHLDARRGKVELASSVVAQNHALDAHLRGAEHVLDALHALEDDGHLGDALEPGNVLPAERRVDKGRDGAGGALARVRLFALLHVAALFVKLAAHVLFAASEHGRIDGNEEALAAAGLGMLDNFAGNVTILVDVELQPLDLVAAPGVDNLVKGARGECGDHLDDVVRLGGTGEDDLALWVTKLAQGGCCDVKGNGSLVAEHGGGKINVLDINEDLGAEPNAVEGAVIFSQCLLRLISIAKTHTWKTRLEKNEESFCFCSLQSRHRRHLNSIPKLSFS